MEIYWRMQWRRICRHITDFGLHPAIGLPVLVLLFSGFSAYLFYRVQYAAYIYAFTAISMAALLAEQGRVEFLRLQFDRSSFRKIRLTENTLAVLPFLLVLVFRQAWVVAAFTLLISMLSALTTLGPKYPFTIPTPFSRYPFEFATGFRRNYWLFALAGFLQIMSVIHTNPHLGLFALMVVLFICLSFYLQAESPYLVWIHAMTPGSFLWYKIRIALRYTFIGCFPFLLVPLIFFPAEAGYVLLVFGLALIYIMTAILGKYAFYPAPINLPAGIMLALAFSFPPFLLFLMPYLYRRATIQLSTILL